MKRLAIAFCAAAAALPSAALACGAHAEQSVMTQAAPAVKEVSVQEVAALRTSGAAKVIDANNAETRAKYGVIPGAVMLTSATRFDPAKELPQDRGAKLVFYCANVRCTASTLAAQRALDAGYSDVSVMPAGIKGWKEAGQATGAGAARI